MKANEIRDPDKIEAEAARWLARQDAGPLDDATTRAFEEWCASDSRRFGAYVRLRAVNARFKRAPALRGLRPRTSRRTWIPASLAAALALAILSSYLLTRPQVETRQLSTALGEQIRTSLPDGSLIEINTSTDLAIELTFNERDIRLERGEAVFEVVHDRSRPFIVKTPHGDVRAVGTVFSVSTLNGLGVAVDEGVVSIEKDGRTLARVAAGETFHVEPSGDTIRRGGQAEEIKRSFAWREGKIAFDGETLAEAAVAFNRYNRVRIEIADPEAGGLRLGGNFRATDPRGFAIAAERSLPVTAKEADGVITFTSRTP